MATNLDIIKRAMKKIHVLASGGEPTSAQAADGMAALQSLIVELISSGSLGRLNDVLAASNYTAYEWDRVHASSGVVVTLPTTITNERDSEPPPFGSSNSVTARAPYDRAPIVVINSSGVPTYSVYNSYKSAWVTINGLTQQGTFPFPVQLENGFAALLAEYLADEFDSELGAETKRQANVCRIALANKADSTKRITSTDYF